MKISVVTISHNQARFLGECMDSVLSQDHPDLEYIIVDPGSTDGSREIIEAYGDSVKALFEPDAGPADGLNRGFALANGSVLGFVNADDKLLPGALACVSRHFVTKAQVDVIAGCGYMIDGRGRKMRRVVSSRFSPWLYVHGAVSVFQQGTFFRTASFKDAGGFNVANGTCWDGELFLDMAMNGARFATVADDLALFRVHDGSITGTGRLNEEYSKDCDRLFTRVMGRERGSIDRPLDVVARMLKYASDPAYLVRRLPPHSYAAGDQ